MTDQDMPAADWASAWHQLTGYMQAAGGDGHELKAEHVLTYMAELRREALRPVTDWINARGGEAATND